MPTRKCFFLTEAAPRVKKRANLDALSFLQHGPQVFRHNRVILKKHKEYTVSNVKTTIVLATRNAGKVRELHALLEDMDCRVLGLDAFPEVGDIPETGTTFEENALIKAKTAAMLTGHIAVADDSGLAVDALHGAPGVYSARFSDRPGYPATDAANIAKLLDLLRDVPQKRRTARFICAAAAATPDGMTLVRRGQWEGAIATRPRGTNGFGYDPVFVAPEYGRHAAELDAAQKNAVSHRRKAFAALREAWPEFLQTARRQGAIA